ncbi:MAG: hypothetical protein ACK56I_26360, partial [bacterium]
MAKLLRRFLQQRPRILGAIVDQQPVGEIKPIHDGRSFGLQQRLLEPFLRQLVAVFFRGRCQGFGHLQFRLRQILV